MRLKHIKGAEEVVENSPYVIKKVDTKKTIHVEIGMGKGKFLYEMAKLNPNIYFIGLEKQASVLLRAIEKQEENPLDNLRFMLMDAKNLEDVFKNNVDTIYLNFSDPWPKKRHEKRRLTSQTFLVKYDNVLKDKKHIILKTDNRSLFAYSIKSFTDYGYKIKNISLDVLKDEIEDVKTEYEEKFMNLGLPIYQIEVLK